MRGCVCSRVTGAMCMEPGVTSYIEFDEVLVSYYRSLEWIVVI
jgi:hypothetical protein